MNNKDNYERPIRKDGTYVKMAHNSNAGTNVIYKGGSLGNYKNKEYQREHCEFVRLYNNKPQNLLKNKGIQCEIPPTEGVRQTGLPSPTPSGNLLMFTPQINAPREPLIPQPRTRVQTDLLVSETPHKLGSKEPQLLPRTPLHPLLEEIIDLEEEQRRLEEYKKANNRRRVSFKTTSTKEIGTEPEEAQYEEIPEKEGENDDDQTTPKSRLPNTVPLRQRRPPKVVVNCTPGSLPRAFKTKTRARPTFQFQEQQTTPLDTPQEATPWQEEDQQLGATGGEGWERQVQHEEHLNEESEEDDWENEQEFEWDNEEFNWQRTLWQPSTASVMEQQQELKTLIDREMLMVHNLELQINSSEALEGIYNNKDTKCSLLYEPQMATVSTNPNHLSDNPRERVRIMADLYEKIQLAKEARVRALENMAEADNVRKSKRLMLKPKKKYN